MMGGKMPTPTLEKWLKIAEEFWSVWNFPNCIVAVDGKHVVITAPANTGSHNILITTKKNIFNCLNGYC
jgi:hypothetical protein